MYVLKNSFHFLSLINKQFKKIVIKNYDNYIFAVDKYLQFEYNMSARRRSNGLLGVHDNESGRGDKSFLIAPVFYCVRNFPSLFIIFRLCSVSE